MAAKPLEPEQYFTSRLRFRRAEDRRRLALAGLVMVAGALFAALSMGLDPEFRADVGTEGSAAPLALHEIRDGRVCATVAVYLQATADDWSQRAAIARAHLNRFEAAGVPNCAPMLARIVEGGIDTVRWQAALAAVDAVTTGSYALPFACVRADTVLPEPSLPGIQSARTQCVINGLAFVETPR